MVRIANEKNVDQLLAELKEYALEVDMDFVRRAVKAIGQAAIKIESASEKCVNTLLDLIATKVNYVVQEAIVVIKDIFRKYPGYEGIIPTLCQYIDELDEPNARGALIWIVGEYAEKISNADEILAGFVEGFMEEFTQTQLQILTAVVKLFLKKPDNNQGLVQKVLQSATAENDNPDIRDRAYVYWRLLSGDLQVAKVCISISLRTDDLRILTHPEHHSLGQTSHHHHNVLSSPSPPRTTPNRTFYLGFCLPQTTRDICRPWPIRCRRYSTRSYSRTTTERSR
jgi:vesicle coat complex subunit